MAHKPSDYLHIRAWGKMMGSHEYYIVGEQEQAAEDNAPLHATYKREGQWNTYEDILAPDTREYIRLAVEKLSAGKKVGGSM